MLNPDENNPFAEKINPGFVFKEEMLKPSDKILFIEIPLIESN